MDEKRCMGCMKIKQNSPICEHCGYDENSKNASHQLPVGTVLKDQYLIGRVLGQGGFGITYLGWDLYLDIPAAIKEYYPTGMVMRENSISNQVSSCSGDAGSRYEGNRERFLREAKMLARFSQVPEVVQVRNFFLDNNTAYIVMEYLEGITLKQYVQDQGGRLTGQQTLEILGTMIRTLSKIHRAGLVHRDISPDNIMMLPGGKAKLLDFGAVRNVSPDGISKSSESILKQGYAPIEQYQRRGKLGPWTDVYAMCATICYCVTGQVPPDAPERLLNDERLDLRDTDLTEKQKKALEHGMALRLEDRIPNMEALYRELIGEEQEKPAPEPPPRTYPRTVPMEPEKTGSAPETAAERKPEKKKAPEPVRKPEKKEILQPEEPAEKPEPVRKKPEKKKHPGAILAAAAVVLAVVCGLIALSLSTGEHIGVPDAETQKVQTIQKGKCGWKIQWSFDPGTGALALEGQGDMDHYRRGDDEESELSPAPWYAFRNQVRSVTLSEGITRVGDYAFQGCQLLREAELPGTVTSLGTGAFEETALQEIDLPEGLREIGVGAFADSDLRRIRIPASVEMLYAAFPGCSELKEITLDGSPCLSLDTWSGTLVNWYNEETPSDVVIQGAEPSAAQFYAHEVGLPFEVIRRDYSNWQRGELQQLNWFYDGHAKTLYIQGEGEMENFGDPEKKGPTPDWIQRGLDIRGVILGEGVRNVGDYAFRNVPLVDVHFSSTVKRIGKYAFAGTRVDEAILPDTVEQVGTSAFSDCQNLGPFYMGPNTLPQSENGWTTVTSPEATAAGSRLLICTVEGSPADRFARENRLDLHLGSHWAVPWVNEPPRDIEPMKDPVSGICPSGIRWKLDRNVGILSIEGSGKIEDYRYGWQGETPIPPWYAFRSEVRILNIDDNIREIGQWAFADCRNLKEITFPQNLKRIAGNAFNGTGLEELRIPESVEVVEPWAFGSCHELIKIEVPGKTYLDAPFQNCDHLEKLSLGEKTRLELTRWYDTNFWPLSWARPSDRMIISGAKASGANIYAELMGIPFEAAFPGEWEDWGDCGTSLIWRYDRDERILYISGQGAMPDYTSGRETPWAGHQWDTETIVVGRGVTHVGDYAFEGFGNCRQIHIGSKVESIGRFAYAGTGIYGAAVPRSVETVGQSAFAGCRSLREAVMGKDCSFASGDFTPFTASNSTRPNRDMRVITVEGSQLEAFARENDLEIIYDHELFS